MSILSNFDPQNQIHVAWLTQLTQEAKDLSPVKSKRSNKIVELMKNNPIGEYSGSELDIAEIHLLLCNKYAHYHLLKKHD